MSQNENDPFDHTYNLLNVLGVVLIGALFHIYSWNALTFDSTTDMNNI